MRFKLSDSPFFKNVATVSLGTLFSQSVSVVTIPILARLYSPASFGMQGLILMISTIGISFSTLQMHHVIITTKDDKDADSALSFSLILALGLSVFSYFFCLLFKPYIQSSLKNDEVSIYFYYLPFMIFFSCLNMLFAYRANRFANYKILSASRVSTALITFLTALMWTIFNKATPSGLLTAAVLGQIIAVIQLMYFFSKSVHPFKFKLNISEVKCLIKNNKKFIYFSLPSDLLNNITQQLPVFILSQFGAATVGAYNMSTRILGLPTSLVSSAVGEVYRQRATKDFHLYNSCRALFLRLSKNLAFVAVPGFLVIILTAHLTFPFFLGQQWVKAGEITQVIGVLYMSRFIVSPFSYTTYICHKQHLALIMDIFLLSCMITISLITINAGLSENQFLTLFALTYSLLYIVTYYIIYKISNPEK